jgi:pimeloyl-ACP methyl ester carboxylesterase
MRRKWIWIVGAVVAVLLLVGIGGFWWLNDLPDPMPEAERALASDETVTVETEPWLTFTPADASDTGLILYPGGRVPAEAYAPAARAIAEAGYLSVITPMPFGLAVLGPDAADDIIEAHPEIERWVIGGHSLGGAMAAGYADGHPDDVEGLALWAAYPADDTNLTDADLAVTSVYATEDGLATLDEIEESAARLPADTVFAEVEGGNHAGFGWYGDQAGDGEATISREDQQRLVVAATLDLLERVETGGP